MERQQELQDAFISFYNKVCTVDGESYAFQSSQASALKVVNNCFKRGKAVLQEDCAIASQYYCLASFVCLESILKNGSDDKLLKTGRKAAGQALEIIKDDYEYQVLNLLYRIISINACQDEVTETYTRLKQINQECPPFHIINISLCDTRWLEDTYNSLFEQKLLEVCSRLNIESPYFEEASTLLKSFPARIARLTTFYNLSRLYWTCDRIDEAARNAKLGIEVLGTDVEYDYKNKEHILWGECWTLVGIISRKKKDYDFAESVLEKGASLGIISCIHPLVEMLENGEGDDPDPEQAEKYRSLAESIEEQRRRVEEEEKERLKKEEEERLAEIRRQEEESAREKRIKQKKFGYWIKIVACWLGSVLCLIFVYQGLMYLKEELIVDRLAKYEKAGFAILNYNPSSNYIIVMNKEGIYFDDTSRQDLMLPVGKSVNTLDVTLSHESSGKPSAETSYSSSSLNITKSGGLKIVQVSKKSFLLYSGSNKYNPMESGTTFKNGYLIVYDGEHPSPSNSTIYNLDNWKTDGEGYMFQDFSGNILEWYGPYFQNVFSKTDYQKIIQRKYGEYNGKIYLSIGEGTIYIGPYNFDALNRYYYSPDIGTDAHKETLQNVISQIFRDEQIELYLKNAEAATGVSYRQDMCISSDDRYTFVINSYYQSGHEPKALLRVDNRTKSVKLIDTAIEIEFEDARIRVRKYDTFLILFDSYNDIYYSYSGTRL